MAVLDPLKSPFAELFEPVQNIPGHSVVDFFPDFIHYADSGPTLFSVEIEPYGKKELGLLYLSQSFHGRPDIHSENSDRITTTAVIKQISGVIIGEAWKVLKFLGVQIEERNVLQPEKAVPQSERIFFPSEKEDLNMLQLPILPVNGGQVVGPASRIAVPMQQLFKDVPYRHFNPDPVDVQHGIFGNVYSDPLHDAKAVVLPFFLCCESDKRRYGRFVKEEMVDIG